MKRFSNESMAASPKPYDRMKDSGVKWLGEVPAHWSVGQVKRHYAVQLGKMLQPRPRDPQDGRVRYLKARNVQWFGLDTSDVDSMYASADEIDRYGVNSGDLLVCEGGEGGRCALAIGIQEFEPCIIQNALHRVRPRFRLGERASRNDYLQFILKTVSSSGWFDALNDKATIAHFTAEKFGALPIPMPPFAEQTAIARFLDHAANRIDRYIRAKEKLIALLEEQKRVTIHDAVTGRIDVRTGEPYPAYKPSSVEWLGEVPTDWDVRPAKWHFREVDERSDTGSEELLSVSHLTGVTPRREKNVTMFKAESNVGHKICRSGDVVINTMWAWMSALGMARQTGIVSPSYAVYRPVGNSSLSGDYGDILLRSAPYNAEYRRLSTGIRPSRLRLYPDTFLRIRLVCPPPDEQSAIMEFVQRESANIDRASDLMRREIDALQEYRTRLIADVVTGKLDVREAADALPKADPLTDETRDNHQDTSDKPWFDDRDTSALGAC